MAKTMSYRRIWFALIGVVLLTPFVSPGKTLQTAGKHFIFSIPEDATHIGNGPRSKLYLHILSPYDGNGVITAPNNFHIEFSFKRNLLKEIELPRTLMHGRTAGKQPIGITVKTDANVNLVLHNILEFAGEATQIWPVEVLGKEYVAPSWGIYNDPLNPVKEDNHAELTISSVNDETYVTITPSVRTLDGIPRDSTFTVRLDRGESYLLKADSSSGKEKGLSGTRIVASSPVSVMTAVTCAYAPQGLQACNMLLDNILPLDHAGNEFYASPLGDTLREAYLIFTSKDKNFTVSISDGRTIKTSSGHCVVEIGKPVKCRTSTPALCHLVTPGVSLAFLSDPSIVTILPVEDYQLKMMWYTPLIVDNGMPFHHSVTVIHEVSSIREIKLDNKPIASLGGSAAISGTAMAVTQVVVNPGVHTLTSQTPVLAVASGFYSADAYSFLPMGIVQETTTGNETDHDIRVTALPQKATKELSVDIERTDSLIELTIFDALGNVVLQKAGMAANLRTIDISGLPNGSYVLDVVSGSHRGKAQFVISQ